MGLFRRKTKTRLKGIKDQAARTMTLYEILGDKAVDILDQVMEDKKVKGGFRVKRWFPLEFQWWVELPEVEEKSDE